MKKKNKELSQRILEKIKKDKIKMRSCLYFKLHAILFFLLAFLSFSISVFLSSLFIENFLKFEPIESFSRLKIFLIFSLPLPLFLLGLFFLYFSGRFYRKGRLKCCHEDWMLFGCLFVGLVFLAIIFSKIDLIKKTSQALEIFEEGKKTTAWRKIIYSSPKRFWSQTEKGTLSGEVVFYDPIKEEMKIVTWKREPWVVDTNQTIWFFEKNKIEQGWRVKMIGQHQGNFFFIAHKIWKWED